MSKLHKVNKVWRDFMSKRNKNNKQKKYSNLFDEIEDELNKPSELYYPNVYIANDIVQTPDKKRGKVTGAKNGEVSVVLDHELTIEIYKHDDLALIEGADGYTGNIFDNNKGSKLYNTVYSQSYKTHCTKSHWMDEFKLKDDLTIYLSARKMHNKREKGETLPDIGCYMDSGWMQDTFWLSPNCPSNDKLFDTGEIPTLYIDWRDMGVIPVLEYSQAIIWCMSRLMEGQKLEIGCYGAHGRTGTLLAGILVYQGMTGTEAIKEVRSQHCKSAIETKVQEELIETYHKELVKLNG